MNSMRGARMAPCLNLFLYHDALSSPVTGIVVSSAVASEPPSVPCAGALPDHLSTCCGSGLASSLVAPNTTHEGTGNGSGTTSLRSQGIANATLLVTLLLE